MTKSSDMIIFLYYVPFCKEHFHASTISLKKMKCAKMRYQEQESELFFFLNLLCKSIVTTTINHVIFKAESIRELPAFFTSECCLTFPKSFCPCLYTIPYIILIGVKISWVTIYLELRILKNSATII